MAKYTFEIAKEKIETKYSYLILLEYNGWNEICSFHDNDYGPFKSHCRAVFRGKSGHIKRGKVNKTINYIKTLKRLYNVTNISQIQSIKDQKAETMIKNYGTTSPFKSEILLAKIKKTNLERYGDEVPQRTEIIKQKTIETNLKIYGKIHSAQDEGVKSKIKETNLKEYGFDHPLKNENVKKKQKQTTMNKYGKEYVLQCPEIREKIRQTNMTNGNYHNINGLTLIDVYNSKDFNVKYTTVLVNYNLYGDEALDTSFYNEYTSKSKVADLWLKSIEEKLGYKLLREYKIHGTSYIADAYDSITNTIYEFYGDYWHGNPKIYESEKYHVDKKMTFRELYNKTINREEEIKLLKNNIETICEDDFYNILKNSDI
jgi:hypothetical protein